MSDAQYMGRDAEIVPISRLLRIIPHLCGF